MKVFGVIVIALAVAFACISLEGVILMWLFNWVCGLFGAAFALTFWQAFGVCALLTFVGGFFKNSSSKK